MQKNQLRKNPSRDTCESIIQRILAAEIAEKGNNRHFRQVADFMPYFESLYPASESLRKQVQRAIKYLEMPKDEAGFFILHKTKEQLTQEKALSSLSKLCYGGMDTMEEIDTIFLKMLPQYADHFIYVLTSCATFQDKIVTATKTYNGIIIFTRHKDEVNQLLEMIVNT